MKYNEAGIPRYNFAVAADGEWLYVAGGRNAGGELLDVFEIFLIKEARWEGFPSMNRARESFSLIFVEDILYAVGGDDENTIEYFEQGDWTVVTTIPEKIGRQIRCFNGPSVPWKMCVNTE